MLIGRCARHGCSNFSVNGFLVGSWECKLLLLLFKNLFPIVFKLFDGFFFRFNLLLIFFCGHFLVLFFRYSSGKNRDRTTSSSTSSSSSSSSQSCCWTSSYRISRCGCRCWWGCKFLSLYLFSQLVIIIFSLEYLDVFHRSDFIHSCIMTFLLACVYNLVWSIKLLQQAKNMIICVYCWFIVLYQICIGFIKSSFL